MVLLVVEWLPSDRLLGERQTRAQRQCQWDHGDGSQCRRACSPLDADPIPQETVQHR